MSIRSFAIRGRDRAGFGLVVALVAASQGGIASCARTTYACGEDDACVDGKRMGICEPVGYCSFDDSECASGRRFGEHADAEHAGACVEDDASTTSGSTTAVTTMPTGDSGPIEGDPYGPCVAAIDCPIEDSACVSNGMNRMCAPPCTTTANPSAECPATVDGDTEHVGCLFTDAEMTTVRCFATCNGTQACPAGMLCAEPVCTWTTQ